MKPSLDLIVLADNIVTMTNQKPRARAIGVKDGRIVAVGSAAEVEELKDESTKMLDLGNRTVLPGFIDSHVHATLTGRTLRSVDLQTVTSVDEILKKLRDRVEITPTGQWVLGFRLNRLTIKEKRFPTLQELDSVSPEHPICIQHFDVHCSVVNSLAYQQFGLSRDMPGVCQNSRGEPTGLVGDPTDLMGQLEGLESENTRLQNVIATCAEALKVGITTLHAKEVPDNISHILKNEDKIPMRVKPFVYLDRWSLNRLDEVLGSEVLRNRACIGIYADGAIEAHTAAFFEPYSDDPSTLGILYYSDEELRGFLEKAHLAGFQISVHCESDRSIEQALLAFEGLLERYPRRDHRHRIEHFEVPTIGQTKRVARAGVALAVQPMFVPLAEGPNLEFYRYYLGEDRVKRANAFRSILDEGILVSGGSDSPCSPLGPLHAIQACLTHPLDEQRIGLYDAIKLFTFNGARIGFEETDKGTIEEGKFADLVVLSEDLFLVSPDKVRDITIDMTIVGGEIAYAKEVLK